MVSYRDFVVENENIILEMKCGDVFQGDVVNVGENLFELVNTRQHNNPNKLQGVYTFYRTEIERIFKLKSQTIVTDKKNDLKLYRISNVDREEYDRLQIMSENYIYLENADNRYYKAVEDLENSETIAIVPLGLDKSMLSDVKLLVICTFQQVYVFDMIHLKDRAFYPELKNIFETKLIHKVFHGGIAFIDILFKNYKVYTTNIFDTQITDLFIEKKKAGGQPPKTTKSLAHCVKNYLKLPPSILKTPQSVSRKNWSERPLSESEKLYASQMCTYLIKLQQVLRKELLKSVFGTIDKVHNHVLELSDVDFKEYVNSNKIPPFINNVIPFQKKEIEIKKTNGECNKDIAEDEKK